MAGNAADGLRVSERVAVLAGAGVADWVGVAVAHGTRTVPDDTTMVLAKLRVIGPVVEGRSVSKMHWIKVPGITVLYGQFPQIRRPVHA